MQTTLNMAYESSECARDNLGIYIYHFQPKTKTHHETWKDLYRFI